MFTKINNFFLKIDEKVFGISRTAHYGDPGLPWGRVFAIAFVVYVIGAVAGFSLVMALIH